MSNPEIVDCHTHTVYSDGSSTFNENFRVALERGITTIACTDHLTLPHNLDPQCEVSVREEDLPALSRDIREAQEKFPRLTVIHGFECDYYPGCEENIAAWSKGASFLLGSVHMLDYCWIDDPNDLLYWDAHDVSYVWEHYFETWAEAAHSPIGFHSMAHPDLVMLFARYPHDSLRRKLYKQAAEAAADANVHVEINTAGLNKACASFYPYVDLLCEFFHAGVPITVGSDAHHCSRIGENILQAYSYAYKCGYRSCDVPCPDGSWRTISL